jgi:shikimate kinase
MAVSRFVVLDAQWHFMSKTARRGTPMQMQTPQLDDMLHRLGQRPIIFVRLMGAGKTAIGRKVAGLLGLNFIDSDHEIEEVSRTTIPICSISTARPNSGRWSSVIARLLEGGPRVLSTGGGAFMNEQTRGAIAAHGVSVWLKADIDVLMERVSKKPAVVEESRSARRDA